MILGSMLQIEGVAGFKDSSPNETRLFLEGARFAVIRISSVA